MRNPAWLEDAKCKGADTDLFFPEPGDTHQVVEAKLMCSECPVRIQCENHFINERHGIFGGRTPDEREHLRNGRPKPFKPPRWFSCPYCHRDIATLDPNQLKCGSASCKDAHDWKLKSDRRRAEKAQRAAS